MLMTSLARENRVPLLHVFEDNASAIALYRDIGFTVRRRFHLSVVRRDSLLT